MSQGATLTDGAFADLPHLLAPGDLVVFNDTRVIKARLRAARPTGGKVELLLERAIAVDEAVFQLRASHPPKPGGELLLPDGVRATVLERDGRFYRLRLAGVGSLFDYLERHGDVPLPPYIARPAAAVDAARYQTVYARHAGAAAAPTAGLHFDAPMLAALTGAGIASAFVTLHVGAGTFQPVETEDLAAHRMHAEWYRIPATTVVAVEAARARGGRIVAVGTTTLRALESAADDAGRLQAGAAETSLFITPGYRFRVVERLLTNFHLPKSTLLMLVSRVRRPRQHPRCLRARDPRTLSLLQLWRRDAARACARPGLNSPPRCTCTLRCLPAGRAAALSALRAAGRALTRANRGAGAATIVPMQFTLQATSGRARRGRLETAHGAVDTPVFMPVGTYGTVKAMAPNELEALGAQIVLGNTFHLWLRPGVEVVAAHGGLHRFMGWPRALLTDSGGFQVWSLGPLRKVHEEGVAFASPVNGDRLLLTPEISMQIQRTLDSDIAMVFDECTRVPRDPRRSGDVDGAVGALGAALARRIRPTRQSARAVRHRAGRDVRRPARRVARGRSPTSASTAMRSAGCRSASRRTKCSRCSSTPRRGCRPIGRAI